MDNLSYNTVNVNDTDDNESTRSHLKRSEKTNTCRIITVFVVLLVIIGAITLILELAPTQSHDDQTSKHVGAITLTTQTPSKVPSNGPTVYPTIEPTTEPTPYPTIDPTTKPTEEPTFYPSTNPTTEPTEYPTKEPTAEPTSYPTLEPTNFEYYINTNNETTVSMTDVIELTFPADFFPSDVTIEINTIYDTTKVVLFEETTVLHRSINVSNITDNQIHIFIDQIFNFTEWDISPNMSLLAVINVPNDIIESTPTDYGFDVFALVYQGSHDEDVIPIYVLFESQYDPVQQVIFVTLYPEIFTNGTASLMIASTPGVRNKSRRRLATANSKCKASSMLCPVKGGCTVTSPFSKSRTIKGETKPHWGTDYRAVVGTEILAAADGKIEESYVSKTFGETIVIRHSDESATLYAHLSERVKKTRGEEVTAGEVIAKSGNTGRSTGPHLHFEYVPNGKIFYNKHRVDPDVCIGTTQTGGITVGDSGSAADDSFSIAIDGTKIAETSIGAWNSKAVSGLLSGNHVLTLTVTYAPDNIGTYTVELRDGLVFEDGTTKKSGRPPEGTVVQWIIVVP